MKTIWTSHLKDPGEIDRFKQVIKNSKSALDRQKEIIESRINVINSIEMGVDIYTKPGWDALQAHYNGEKAALTWIKKLIDLDQEDLNDR